MCNLQYFDSGNAYCFGGYGQIQLLVLLSHDLFALLHKILSHKLYFYCFTTAPFYQRIIQKQ